MTTSIIGASEQRQNAPSLYKAVSAAAYRLSGQLLGPDHGASARARATLSRLRRGAAVDPTEDPITWGLVVDEILADIPPEEAQDRQGVSWSEWAAYTSLALFALHQQSLSQPMHVAKVNLGHAVGRLSQKSESGSIKARLDSLLVANSPTSIRYHLRSLVSLLNAHQIAVDYGQLAEDLRRLRSPRTAGRVRVAWARGFVQGSRASRAGQDDTDPIS